MIRIEKLNGEQLKRYHEVLQTNLEFALADDDPDLELIRDLSEHLRNVRELLRKGEHVQ
jgi:hypothetical protein